MDPRIAKRKQLDAAEATVKGLAEVRQELAELREMIVALGRMVKEMKDGGAHKSHRRNDSR